MIFSTFVRRSEDFSPHNSLVMKNVVVRSLSGAVYIALIVGSIFAGKVYFLSLLSLFAIVAVLEMKNITSANAKSPICWASAILELVAATALVWLSSMQNSLQAILICLVGFFVIRAIISLYDKREDAFPRMVLGVFSVVYVALPLAMLAMLYQTKLMPLESLPAEMSSFFDELQLIFSSLLEDTQDFVNPDWHVIVLFIFIGIWINDTGAYCVGSTIGRHRLFPRLSPKKSWEGFWGGFAFCLAWGCAIDAFWGQGFGLLFWLGFGVIICVFSTLGDLFESLIKRKFAVKDSGNIIPGHGGVLDRIDSLLFTAPAIAIYCYFVL